MVKKFLGIDSERLREIKETILNGEPIDISVAVLLATFIGNMAGKEKNLDGMFAYICDKADAGTLRENKDVIYVLDALQDWYVNDSKVVNVKGFKKTILSADSISALIEGQSGKFYTANIITKVDNLLTGNKDVLKSYANLVEELKDESNVSPLQCLVEGIKGDKLYDTLVESLEEDTYAPTQRFNDIEALLEYLGESNGFVIKVDKRIIIVYEEYNTETGNTSAVVLANVTDSKNFITLSPAVLYKVFE